MTTILWFLVGIMAIIGIARYYEDEKLFWKLFISFAGAYGVATIAINSMEQKEDKITVVSQNPMQVPIGDSYCLCTLAELSNTATNGMKVPAPAGKEIFDTVGNPISSKVGQNTRDRPNNPFYFDTS